VLFAKFLKVVLFICKLCCESSISKLCCEASISLVSGRLQFSGTDCTSVLKQTVHQEVNMKKPHNQTTVATKPLSEALKPQDAPTPRPSRNLGAKEEQVNREQTSSQPDSDAPGG
jgi:hypothetical protein